MTLAPELVLAGKMARHRIAAVVSDPFLAPLGESFFVSLGGERAAW